MAQKWCEGFKIGIANWAECLALSLMFLEHLEALVVFSPSKGIFCHYTNTHGGC